VEIFIPVYIVSIALTAVTVFWAAALSKNSGQRLHRAFFFFVILNDSVCLADVLFQYLPNRVAGAGSGSGAIAGFLVFPLLAAFTYLVLEFQFALAGMPFPAILRKAWIAFWGLLFVGFLAAEFRQIVDRDFRLTQALQPVFNSAIVISGLGSALFIYLRGRTVADPAERRFIRTISGYIFIAFLVFGVLFYSPLPLSSGARLFVRSLLGFLYLFPLLVWMNGRFRKTKNALLTGLAGAGAALDRWFESKGLSPREREIARRVLEGKSNAAIEKELFIGRRTVESHLYSIYRKTGVKSRLQLARLAASEIAAAAE